MLSSNRSFAGHALTSTSSFSGCYDARVLAAFEHSTEHAQLLRDGLEPRILPSLLELAESLWLTPDDITGPLLIELLHDTPRMRDYDHDDIPAIVRELAAFWSFAHRECQYPHAQQCLSVIERDAAQALECALARVPSPAHALLSLPPPGPGRGRGTRRRWFRRGTPDDPGSAE